tara:strand:- start:13331 stop:14569 length:1239 start_codon:yes stop_codon:yes gene_type:complete
MKLAVFVDQFPVISQTFVLNQVDGLIAQGIDVTVIALSDPRANVLSHDVTSAQNEMVKKTVIYLLDEENDSLWRKFLKRACKLMPKLLWGANRKRILSALNLYYGHHAKSLLLPTIVSNIDDPLAFDFIICHFGTGGVLINKLRDIGVIAGKIATIFHGFELSIDKTLAQQKDNYLQLFEQTELMLPISELWKNKLKLLGCPSDKIAVHRMGVDLRHFAFKYTKMRGDTLSIFTVARFTEKKGLEYAIRALALLTNDIKFHYTIAGFGELLQPLKLLVNELALDDYVSFIGAIDSVQVKEQMLAAHAFIQPSITASNGDMEGVPVAIMEAMAMGTPVISSYHSGISELITHGEHGLLAQEKDSLALAENIRLLYKNEPLQKRLAIQARKRIEEFADIDRLNKQLLVLLNKHQ